MWDRSLNGTVETTERGDSEVVTKVKPDNRLAMRMLEKRDPSYQPTAKIERTGAAEMTPREMFEALQRIQRLALARQPLVVEGTAEEITELDRQGLLSGDCDGLPEEITDL